MILPASFSHRMQRLLENGYAAFEESLGKPPVVSIRTNPRKPVSLNHLPLENTVPWCEGAYYLSGRPSFTEDPLFHAGAYYVQDASAMLIHLPLRQYADLSKPLMALDLCAAPGGKSTLLLQSMNSCSLLVANDAGYSRAKTLSENLARWGCPNCVVSCRGQETFAHTGEQYDVIVLDAPCSGEGMFRKNRTALEQWSDSKVRRMVPVQRALTDAAVAALRTGGILIYSTCAFSEEENEQNIRWAMEKYAGALECLPLTADPAWGLVQNDAGLRAYPHLTRGEGQFVSCIRKILPVDESRKVQHERNENKAAFTPAGKEAGRLVGAYLSGPDGFEFYTRGDEVFAVPASLAEAVLETAGALHPPALGIHAGKFRKNIFTPSHGLALSCDLRDGLPRITLQREDALAYLRGGLPRADIPASPGRYLAVYEGLPLGWIKCSAGRVHNCFPYHLRIRKSA